MVLGVRIEIENLALLAYEPDENKFILAQYTFNDKTGPIQKSAPSAEVGDGAGVGLFG